MLKCTTDVMAGIASSLNGAALFARMMLHDNGEDRPCCNRGATGPASLVADAFELLPLAVVEQGGTGRRQSLGVQHGPAFRRQRMVAQQRWPFLVAAADALKQRAHRRGRPAEAVQDGDRESVGPAFVGAAVVGAEHRAAGPQHGAGAPNLSA